jgi:hypothetical protein
MQAPEPQPAAQVWCRDCELVGWRSHNMLCGEHGTSAAEQEGRPAVAGDVSVWLFGDRLNDRNHEFVLIRISGISDRVSASPRSIFEVVAGEPIPAHGAKRTVR